MAKLSLYVLAVLLTTAAATVAEAHTNLPTHLPVVIPDLVCKIFHFDFNKCWVSIAKVQGCAADLIKSVSHLKVHGVSAECCKAIIDVDHRCFSLFGGLFKPVLKSHCMNFFPNARVAETPGGSAWGNEGQ